MKKTQKFRPILTGLLRLFSLFYNKKKFHRRRSAKHLKKEFEQLQQLSQSKDQLFAIISHDLRSAVHSLQINIAHLKSLLTRNEIQEAMLLADNTEQIIFSTRSLLNNLLYWSLSQTGQLTFHPEKFSVQQVVNEVCYDFLPIAASGNIALYYSLIADFSCIADVNSVKLVLRNLVDNAVKYTPANGAVTIAARQEDNYCYITVQDTGIGMNREIIDSLFTGGARRIQQDISGRQSTGIGLWLAKNMVEKNGGTLRISSDTGMGTTVRFSVPMST
jgi:signal transduction histidine kinase